ncbi:hypothetical protein EIN_024020 [Entamoeba invadens IP1]|uniref:hypothetical protein n=1 Tax=Entamoeba invadens IP1 TaxID=370355 RepID=UPI0002C3F962|nr:hypothetical protein EIN_024020 [Entamoeba invadens IP1]ELP90693.1 hypothetical protein EIN_024020 [Entamoeba invadens IP1]|eukprot:XP_004257464.1 hypothetical protein EIN_024020 [Entamoeba invadens IP1]
MSSFKEKISFYKLSPIEVEVEKCCRDDLKGVKEKHVKKVIELTLQYPNSVKEALLKRFNKPFTPKSYTNFVYLSLRLLLTEVNPLFVLSFSQYSAPFETLYRKITSESNIFILTLSQYIDYNITLGKKERKLDPDYVWSLMYEVKYQFNFFYLFQTLEDMLLLLCSCDYADQGIYTTETFFDLVQVVTIHVSIIYVMTLGALRETINGFLVVIENTIFDNLEVCLDKFLKVMAATVEYFSTESIPKTKQRTPVVHLLDISQFIQIIKLRRKIEFDPTLQKQLFPFDQCGVVVRESLKMVDNDITLFKPCAQFDSALREDRSSSRSSSRGKGDGKSHLNFFSKSGMITPPKQKQGVNKSRSFCITDQNEDIIETPKNVKKREKIIIKHHEDSDPQNKGIMLESSEQ